MYIIKYSIKVVIKKFIYKVYFLIAKFLYYIVNTTLAQTT